MNDEVTINGTFEPAYRRVYDAFVENFRTRGEVGAAVAVTHRGKGVVDLWGGVADVAGRAPWQRDTMVCMMSVAKGISALLVHMLADRKLIDLERPVAAYWPKFAQNGKADIPVKWALSHLAGVPIVDGLGRGAIYDWQLMTNGIARQAPTFKPGTVRCYHTATMGFILGELIRRTTGKSLGEFLHDEVTQKFDIDYHIGLPAGHGRSIATMIPIQGNALNLAQANSDSPIGKAWAQLPLDEDFNSVAWRAAEIPSANGHGTARGIAKLDILANGGTTGGKVLIGKAALARGIEEQWYDKEYLTDMVFRVALGFFLNCPPTRPMGPNKRTFGHSGAGGAQSFADPDLGLGFCYAPNSMHGGLDIGARAQALIEATFDCA